MIIRFERNDITKMKVDCIVNAANNTLLGGGGVDGQIHKVAGEELLKECMKLGGCETGEAKITKGYKLPAKYIIHTVGPIYRDGKQGEAKLLANCYYNSLALAKEKKIKTIAFPLISAGIFGYPKQDAISIAIKSMKKFGKENPDYDITATLVLFGKDSTILAEDLFGKIESYIDDNYVDEKDAYFGRDRRHLFGGISSVGSALNKGAIFEKLEDNCCSIKECIEGSPRVGRPIKKKKEADLAELIDKLDLSFAEALVKLIEKKKLKDVDVYNNANMDRKLFSKIRNGSHPKKITALALCIALELNLEETNNLLKKAGYVLTNSEKLDVIVTYYIEHKQYDINEINATLFSFDLQQLSVT